MKIRSFTCFYHPGKPDSVSELTRVTELRQAGIQRLTASGYQIQTSRLVTNPFPEWLSGFSIDQVVPQVLQMEKAASDLGYDFLSLGPALPEFPEAYALIPELMKATQNIFFCAVMATMSRGVNLTAVRACAEIISNCALLSADGFANTRFTACANVPPFVPFFPAAYHSGGEPVFGLAIECADLAIEAFTGVPSLEEGRRRLLDTLNSHGEALGGICEALSSTFRVRFAGMDFSLAPFPNDWCSLGAAIELLGPDRFGMAGTLAAAAYLADTLDRGKWKRTGFNGLMLPVLEDSRLGLRSTDGSLTLKDLLLCSAVCGCGLDTVPLPGDITIDQLTAILVDVAALALRLDKPLTARLMPIPGKTTGTLTAFDFGYFANSGVIAPNAASITGLMAAEQSFNLKPRWK